MEGSRLTKAFAKIHYAYERNRVTNWANDVTPYIPSQSTSIWLAGKDPNYDAQILMFIVGLGW